MKIRDTRFMHSTVRGVVLDALQDWFEEPNGKGYLSLSLAVHYLRQHSAGLEYYKVFGKVIGVSQVRHCLNILVLRRSVEECYCPGLRRAEVKGWGKI